MAHSILERLRAEAFNAESEKRLASHPFLLAAERGEVSASQRRAFACEQYIIIRSDTMSFANLAGHKLQSPDDEAPPVEAASNSFFHKVYEGELIASKFLKDHARWLGIEDPGNYEPLARAQMYPSFLARLSLTGQHAATAAACAVNFPAWGRMCKRLAAAYRTHFDAEEQAVAFLDFFATPMESLEEMVAVVIDESDAPYEQLAQTVRLLQEYEVMFWDAMLDA